VILPMKSARKFVSFAIFNNPAVDFFSIFLP
jgi:hypothetical protein